MAMRPLSPPVTAGNTALVTCGGVTRIFGVQYVAGRPVAGAFRGSSIGETERYTMPFVTQTAYALPRASRLSHGKTAGWSVVTRFVCHDAALAYPLAVALATW